MLLNCKQNCSSIENTVANLCASDSAGFGICVRCESVHVIELINYIWHACVCACATTPKTSPRLNTLALPANCVRACVRRQASRSLSVCTLAFSMRGAYEVSNQRRTDWQIVVQRLAPKIQYKPIWQLGIHSHTHACAYDARM